MTGGFRPLTGVDCFTGNLPKSAIGKEVAYVMCIGNKITIEDVSFWPGSPNIQELERLCAIYQCEVASVTKLLDKLSTSGGLMVSFTLASSPRTNHQGSAHDSAHETGYKH